MVCSLHLQHGEKKGYKQALQYTQETWSSVKIVRPVPFFFVQKDIKDFIMNTKKSSILYQFFCATKLTPKPQ